MSLRFSCSNGVDFFKSPAYVKNSVFPKILSSLPIIGIICSHFFEGILETQKISAQRFGSFLNKDISGLIRAKNQYIAARLVSSLVSVALLTTAVAFPILSVIYAIALFTDTYKICNNILALQRLAKKEPSTCARQIEKGVEQSLIV